MSQHPLGNLDVNALFLGPKSENARTFKELLASMVDEHIFWRRNFHPEDKAFVTHSQQRSEPFCQTLDRMQEVLYALSSRLRSHCVPWFSPRYMGHMNTDILMPAVLGYVATMLYNPNNCAYEGSPATTQMELEVGQDLARMLGYDPQKSWGHVTSGGTVANYEALWAARNLKSIPLAIRQTAPQLVDHLDDWQLLNLSVPSILDLIDQVRSIGAFEAMRAASARTTGLRDLDLGAVLVSQTRHYSWDKAVDIFGIGHTDLIKIQVDANYRMDLAALRKTLERRLADRQPVLAVVAMVGTTEEAAVDQIHEIVALREEYQQRGLSFYLHLDAAYGGYGRSIFLDEHDQFMSLDEARQIAERESDLPGGSQWIKPEVYEAFQAMPAADSMTVDCHKMGYVAYPAGAIVYRDKRILDVNGYIAAYVEGASDPLKLGPYIMEGSKPGAAAAAVWVAHQVIPLNVTGYGKLVGRSVDAAAALYQHLKCESTLQLTNGSRYCVHVLTQPDFNALIFAFNREGNTDLAAMNSLNEGIYRKASYVSGSMYHERFMTSKTFFTPEDYGEIPRDFVTACGIPGQQWDEVQKVFVLRACVVTPFLAQHSTFADAWRQFTDAIKAILLQLELET